MRIGRLLRNGQQGFTYLGIFIFLVVIGIGMAAVGEVWETSVRREKERDLLLAGREIRDAIGRYHAAGVGSGNRYPPSLDALLKDNRVPGIRRHLRRIPVDPMTGSADWAIVGAPGGGVAGVRSRSDESPLKTANFDGLEEVFADAKQYSEWTFIFVPEARQVTLTPGRGL